MMTELLPKRDSVFTQHQFYTLDCCQLAADTFLHPIHFHTSSGAMIYIFLWQASPITKRIQLLSTFKQAISTWPSTDKDLMFHIRQFTQSMKMSVSGTNHSNRSLFQVYCSVHGPIRHPNAFFLVSCNRYRERPYPCQIWTQVVRLSSET
jgi:hypothetical protein